MPDHCPNCGSVRLGAFRFCRDCGFDFESTPTELGSTQAAPVEAIASRDIAVTPRATSRLTRRRTFGLGVAVVVGLAAIGSVQPPPPSSPASAASTATPEPTRATVPTPVPTPAPTYGPTGATVEARVLRVIDGDTIEVEIGGGVERVRYIGIDAPETSDPSSPVQPIGPEATAANAELVGGRTVLLEADASEVDGFGRLLRHVWVFDGRAWLLVNRELVRRGVAIAKSYPPDVRYDDDYRDAEAAARRASLGLWAPSPTPPPTPVPTPTPAPTPEPEPEEDCHPSYDPCLPIVDDLNCPDVRAMGLAPVRVLGSDPYRLDGDHDGIGCE